MKKFIIAIFLFTVILLTVVSSCSTSKEVRVNERRNANGVVIKKKKTVRDDNNKDVTVKVKKERKRDRNKDRNDEPVIIIDKNR